MSCVSNHFQKKTISFDLPGLFGGGTSGGSNYQVYGDGGGGGGGYGAPSDSYGGGGGGGGSSYAAPSSSYDARSSYDYRTVSLLAAICQRRSVPLLLLLSGGYKEHDTKCHLVQDENYEAGEYRALQDNLLAAQNDYLEDREGKLAKRLGDLVAPVAQKLGEAAAKMIQ